MSNFVTRVEVGLVDIVANRHRDTFGYIRVIAQIRGTAAGGNGSTTESEPESDGNAADGQQRPATGETEPSSNVRRLGCIFSARAERLSDFFVNFAI